MFYTIKKFLIMGIVGVDGGHGDGVIDTIPHPPPPIPNPQFPNPQSPIPIKKIIINGDWDLGIGPNPQSPIPNPQSPIPNPQ